MSAASINFAAGYSVSYFKESSNQELHPFR